MGIDISRAAGRAAEALLDAASMSRPDYSPDRFTSQINDMATNDNQKPQEDPVEFLGKCLMLSGATTAVGSAAIEILAQVEEVRAVSLGGLGVIAVGAYVYAASKT